MAESTIGILYGLGTLVVMFSGIPREGKLQDIAVMESMGYVGDRVKEHLENPDCAACHSMMDPIGLGLENFDGIGRYREMEQGKKIDASGNVQVALASGAQFVVNGDGKRFISEAAPYMDFAHAMIDGERSGVAAPGRRLRRIALEREHPTAQRADAGREPEGRVAAGGPDLEHLAVDPRQRHRDVDRSRRGRRDHYRGPDLG